MSDAHLYEPSADPMPAATPVASDKASKFKIGETSTHEHNGTNVDLDSPNADPEPAEPAASSGQTTTSTATAPASGDNAATTTSDAEPAEEGLGSSLPTSTAPAATTATADKPAEPKVTLEDILKAEGYDDDFITMAKIYKEEGKLDRFVEAKGKDYGKMSDSDVLREALVKANPGATPEELDVLYQEEIHDKYKLDPEKFDPEGKEAKQAKVRMGMDARKARAELTEASKKYALPVRDQAAAAAEQARQAEVQRQQQEAELKADPYLQSVLTGKKMGFKNLSITDKEGKVITTIPDFHVPLTAPEVVQQIMTNQDDAFVKHTTLPDGKRDMEALAQIAAFTMNRRAMIQKWITYGMTLGRDQLLDTATNPRQTSNTQRSPADGSPKSIKEAFKAGRHSTVGAG